MNKDAIKERIKEISQTYSISLKEDIANSMKLLYKNFLEYPELFLSLHNKLNHLFTFMNYKATTEDSHYNAQTSRDLLNIITFIDELKSLYKSLEYNLEVDEFYQKEINYVKYFLKKSYGSKIPQDYKVITVKKLEPIFKISLSYLAVNLDEKLNINERAKVQIKKIADRIAHSDYGGAITICRTLLETVFHDLYNKKTGRTLDSKGDLIKDWQKISKELNLMPGDYNESYLKKILQGLTTIINGIAGMRNNMSDSHLNQYTPQNHHAVLAQNCTLTIIQFLFSTYNYQLQRK